MFYIYSLYDCEFVNLDFDFMYFSLNHFYNTNVYVSYNPVMNNKKASSVLQAHAQREESYCALMKHRQSLSEEKHLLKHYMKENERLKTIGNISDGIAGWRQFPWFWVFFEWNYFLILADKSLMNCLFELCFSFLRAREFLAYKVKKSTRG